jgi:hypothetical protein
MDAKTNGALVVAVGAALLLTACHGPKHPKYAIDPTLRAVRFEACMKLLPAGPRSTVYNDWDEVVDSCDAAAWRQSKVCVANCPSALTPESGP